jgi:hypothetical protein
VLEATMRDGASRKANPVAPLPLGTATEATRPESDSPLMLRGFAELRKRLDASVRLVPDHRG